MKMGHTRGLPPGGKDALSAWIIISISAKALPRHEQQKQKETASYYKGSMLHVL